MQYTPFLQTALFKSIVTVLPQLKKQQLRIYKRERSA